MKKYTIISLALIISCISCIDSTETINAMTNELKSSDIFQVKGFRGKEVQISSKDQEAFELLKSIDSLSVEMLGIKFESESTSMLEMYQSRRDQSLKFVKKNRDRAFKSTIEREIESIKKNNEGIKKENEKIDSLKQILNSYIFEIDKLKENFNELNYSVKF